MRSPATTPFAQISLTMTIKSHVVPELQREAAGRMDALLGLANTAVAG